MPQTTLKEQLDTLTEDHLHQSELLLHLLQKQRVLESPMRVIDKTAMSELLDIMGDQLRDQYNQVQTLKTQLRP